MSRPSQKRRDARRAQQPFAIEPQIDRRAMPPQSGPMSRTDLPRSEEPNNQLATVPKDSGLALFLGFRAWLKDVVRRMNFKVVGACAGFVANAFALPLMPVTAYPAAVVGATGLGALIGRAIDAWLQERRQRRKALLLEPARTTARECRRYLPHPQRRERRVARVTRTR